MVDHLQDAALDALQAAGGIGKEPEHDKAHVGDTGVGDELLHVFLYEAHQGAEDNSDDRQDGDPGSGLERGLGKERDREADEAVDAELEEHPGQDDAAGGGGLGVGIGKPGVYREEGDLDGEAQGEGEKAEHAGPACNRVLLHRGVDLLDAKGSRVLVEVENRQEHQQAARHGVDKELHRRPDPFGAAPDPDQQVHGDQHDLPEYVEEYEIECDEDADDARGQQQQGDMKFPHPLLD